MSLRLKNGFNPMPDATLETKSYQILTGMTDNPNFPTPVPSLTVIGGAVEDFFTALSNCAEGDRLKIAIKNQKRAALIDVLHQLAFYVLLTANGDEAIAMSSGFSIAKNPSPAPPIEKPVAPILESGINPGEMVSRGTALAGAVTYLHQYATDAMMAQDNWQS
ncbi:MAG: hypothetical protein ACRDE5_08185, partial [Ginsengibacter sp.]